MHVDQYSVDHVDKRARMRRGPFLLDDGFTLVVPSEYYSPRARAFWSSHGFRWNGAECSWIADTRQEIGGRRFSPSAWLQSTRERFYQFYPEYRPL